MLALIVLGLLKSSAEETLKDHAIRQAKDGHGSVETKNSHLAA